MNIYGNTNMPYSASEILPAYKVLRAIRSTSAFGKEIYEAMDCGMFFLHEMAKELQVDNKCMSNQYDRNYHEMHSMHREKLIDNSIHTLDSMMKFKEWSPCKEEINTAKAVLDYYRPQVLPLFVDLELANKYEELTRQAANGFNPNPGVQQEVDRWTVFSGSLPNTKAHMEIYVRVVGNEVDTWTEFSYEISLDGKLVCEDTVESDSFIDMAELSIGASDLDENLQDFDVLVRVVPVNPSVVFKAINNSLSTGHPIQSFMEGGVIPLALAMGI